MTGRNRPRIRRAGLLDKAFILDVHRLITLDIPHPDNRPGLIRDNPKHRITTVGDEAHGGRYKPPQSGKDVLQLLDALVEWHRELEQAGVPALIRAPLVHYYYEQIHPFWDGNGRVGRVIEATLLQAAGYRYAPFAMARYYLDTIDTSQLVQYLPQSGGKRQTRAESAVCRIPFGRDAQDH